MFSVFKINIIDSRWCEKRTADGVPYYFNTATESISWDKPLFLQTSEERAVDKGEWVWVTDETSCWMPARVDSRGGGTLTVKTSTGTSKKIQEGNPKESLWPLQLSSLKQLVDDLVGGY